ncbi:kinase-like protein [Epithele typhae]|uniref:kinase-like protein n=1 Tax=Epithele typhae TaxID=378194 RepID=UPI00200741F1|nr:kinase-like protein [Epithele typhae]KAH9920882.1 kinase-like protein [Epithele typhae]
MVISPVRNNSGDDLRSRVGAVPATRSRLSQDPRSGSPNSADSHSSASSSGSLSTGTGSASSDSRPQTVAADVQEWKVSETKPRSLLYSDPSPEPSPRVASFAETFAVSVTTELREPEVDLQRRPSIVTDTAHFLSPTQANGAYLTPVSPSSASPSPSSPAPVYPGWLSAVVAPLKGFINDQIDPRDLYTDLQEIAEGESGSVYAARVIVPPAGYVSPEKEPGSYVAIKNIAIMPSGCPKIDDLQKELTLMKGITHANILTMDAFYVDLQEDSLWIRMDLMTRSVADVIALVEEGIQLSEKFIARVAADILDALQHLQSRGIAHRDVRSDNLLVDKNGVIKLADFSNAVRVSHINPSVTGAAGVIYWQAPEVRMGPYNALKVDVWSLGATVWELVETEPPFSDVTDPRQLASELPELSDPEAFSRSLHDFLHLCSRPSASRPAPHDLLNTSFIRGASSRQAIVDVLADCQAIESGHSRPQSTESSGTVSRS